MTEYLSTLTIPALREIGSRMGLTIKSKMVKADIVAMVAHAVAMAWLEASEMDAVIEGAYGPAASDAGISLPAYLACMKGHRRRGEVQMSNFWNCCTAHPAKVVVFDDGSRQAVCLATASSYTGEIEELPVGHNVTCPTCQETYREPITREQAETSYLAAIDLSDVDAMSEIDRMAAVVAAFWLKAISERELTERFDAIRHAYGRTPDLVTV